MKLIVCKICCAFCLLLCVACIEGVESGGQPTLTSNIPSAKVRTSTLPLTEQWRLHTGIPNASSSFPSFVFIVDGKAIVSFFDNRGDDGFGKPFLTALSLGNGQLIWQTPYGDKAFGSALHDALLFPEEKRLYLVYSFQISGFDLDTGKPLWPAQNLAGHTAYLFVQNVQDTLLIRSSNKEIIAFDPQNGHILYRKNSQEPFQTFEHNQIVIYNDGIPSTLSAVDRLTGQTLWSDAPFDLEYRPTFLDGDMLIQRDAPLYRFFRLNIQSGAVVWSKAGAGFVSNYAISENQVYALDNDRSLVAWDLSNGNELGKMEFDRPFTKVGTCPFWVVAEGPYVLVYLGDSQELIAFKAEGKSEP